MPDANEGDIFSTVAATAASATSEGKTKRTRTTVEDLLKSFLNDTAKGAAWLKERVGTVYGHYVTIFPDGSEDGFLKLCKDEVSGSKASVLTKKIEALSAKFGAAMVAQADQATKNAILAEMSVLGEELAAVNVEAVNNPGG